MSINNLEQHLSWLLQSKLFIPPPATHALPEVDSPQSAQQLNPAPNDDLFFVQSNDGSQTEDGNELAARAAEPPGGVVMPRVRTAPSPARKPRLVNQSSCPVSGTNLESRKDTATRLRHTDRECSLWISFNSTNVSGRSSETYSPDYRLPCRSRTVTQEDSGSTKSGK